MAVVEKKIPPEFYELIASGKKKFELRVADFDIQEGDNLVLNELDSKAKKYTGMEIKRKVGYKLFFQLDKFGQRKMIEKHGLYVLQLEN